MEDDHARMGMRVINYTMVGTEEYGHIVCMDDTERRFECDHPDRKRVLVALEKCPHPPVERYVLDLQPAPSGAGGLKKDSPIPSSSPPAPEGGTGLAVPDQILENPTDIARRTIDEATRGEIATYTAAADQLLITNANGEWACDKIQQGIARLIGRIKGLFAPRVSFYHNQHRAFTTARGEVLKPLEAAHKAAAQKRGRYRTECRQREQAEAAKIQAEQRAADDERRLAQAEALEASGQNELADRVLDAPAIPVAPVILRTEAPKTADSTERTGWAYEVVNEDMLPRKFVRRTPNRAAIGPVVRAMGPAAEREIPGIRVFRDTTVSHRG